jgi:hypothetical protein
MELKYNELVDRYPPGTRITQNQVRGAGDGIVREIIEDPEHGRHLVKIHFVNYPNNTYNIAPQSITGIVAPPQNQNRIHIGGKKSKSRRKQRKQRRQSRRTLSRR